MSEEDFLDYGDVGESESDGGGAPTSHEADQIDLYADLTGASEVSENQESYLEVQQRADAASAKSTKLSRQVALLQKKCDILTKQNTALKKNISCLYKTAKLEIDRKDTEIQRLHAQQAFLLALVNRCNRTQDRLEDGSKVKDKNIDTIASL